MATTSSSQRAAIAVLLIWTGGAVACSNSSDDKGAAGTGGVGTDISGHGSGGSGGKSGSGGARAHDAGDADASTVTHDAGALPTADEVIGWIDDYKSAHPGKAGDINNKTLGEITADPDAQRLLSLCGEDQRPVMPALSWEYGGGDHAWINPQMSALVYCVYIPVSPSSSNWQYDAGADHVTADVYVLFSDQNPCKGEQGAAQVTMCIGDPTNFEILVDTASLNDGDDAGLSLSEASTELKLILPGGMKLHLFDGT